MNNHEGIRNEFLLAGLAAIRLALGLLIAAGPAHAQDDDPRVVR